MIIDENVNYFIGSTYLSQNFTNYIKTELLNVYIIQNNEKLYMQCYISVLDSIKQISTSIFQITSPNQIISQNNRDVFLLTYNLLNDFYLKWNKATEILVSELMNQNTTYIIQIILFVFSFVISIISFFIIRQLLNQFIKEREKSVDLFLSIKKNKFEELKISAETFLNKLFNKLYGNEETEEDMLDETAMTIDTSDFNIQQFTKHVHKKPYVSSGTENMALLLRVLGFFLFFQIYMVFKFSYYQISMKNFLNFSDIYHSTQFLQSDLVLTVDIHKQYLYNTKIPILSKFTTKDLFEERVLNLANSFTKMLKVKINQ